MIISVPTSISENYTTNVVDSTPMFSTTDQTSWVIDDKVQFEKKIYVAKQDITVLTWGLQDSYKIGDVVWGEGYNPNQVMYATEGETNKHPGDYITGWTDAATPIGVDVGYNYTTWSERYVMLSVTPVALPYSFIYTTPDSFTHEYTFGMTPDGLYSEVTLTVKNASGTVVYSKYDGSERLHWDIGNLSNEVPASIIDIPGSTYDAWFPVFTFYKDDLLFIRSTVSDALAPTEYKYVTGVYLFKDITSPADIPAFVYLEDTNDSSPFNGSNYTKATTPLTTMTYTVTATEKFNMFVLGYVIGSTLDYTISNGGGSSTGMIIDCSRDDSNVLKPWYTTKIIYSATTVPIGGTVSITIHGDAGTIELGTFKLGAYVDAGMTNLTLQNSYKDFSVFEYDPWGNPSHTDRAKVSVYSGTVDIPISDYDRVDRLMTSLGKNVVIIDGSDNTSNLSVNPSNNIFAATQKIGRFMAFDQRTAIRSNDIDPLATYTFTLEEIV